MWPPDHLEDLCTLQSVTSHWLKAQSSQGAENWITKQTKKSQLCMYFSKQHFFCFFLVWIGLFYWAITDSEAGAVPPAGQHTLQHWHFFTVFLQFASYRTFILISPELEMVRRVKTKKEQAAPLRFMSYESCNSKSTHFRRRKMEQKL